jgi:PAS domain S-box-containing protein
MLYLLCLARVSIATMPSTQENEMKMLSDDARFRTILNAVQAGILMIEAENHKIVYANPVALHLIGAKSDEVIGAVCHSFLCPAEVGKCPITDLGQNIDNAERVIINSRRERVPVLKTVVPTILQNRKYLIESFLDITERKEMEQRLLAERLTAIGQLAGMVGHDLRNPLQGIAGATSVLRLSLDGRADERTDEMLQTIDSCVKYANGIVSDLLDYTGELRLDMTKTNMRQVMNEVRSLIQVPSNITVVDLTESKSEIAIDVDRIKRVFINLMKNAVDAMPKGGKLTITSRESTGTIEIVFADTGVGITKEVLERMWSPLFTTKSKGIGLGLVICKRIVEAHGGSIRAESSVGKGSTFTASLPLANSL